MPTIEKEAASTAAQPAAAYDPATFRPLTFYDRWSVSAPGATVHAPMPCGVQIMGQPNDDARMTAIARSVAENVEPVKAG
jgi:Asp-tRNA(Asn)/Glu-tRNA(Gln) amidotransferase A subunit family amidase